MSSSTPVRQAASNQSILEQPTTKLCLWVLAVCMSLAALASLYYSYRLAADPYQRDYEEGNILNAGAMLERGLTPYPPEHSWPVVLNPYGPVPYAIVAGLIHVGG